MGMPMQQSARFAEMIDDGTGIPKFVGAAYDPASLRGGRCVLFGVMPSDQRVIIHTLPLHFGRILTGSEGGQGQPHQDIPRLLDALGSHQIDSAGFVSHPGSLSEANDIMTRMRAGEVIHAVLQP